jgi:hypothetical protein
VTPSLRPKPSRSGEGVRELRLLLHLHPEHRSVTINQICCCPPRQHSLMDLPSRSVRGHPPTETSAQPAVRTRVASFAKRLRRNIDHSPSDEHNVLRCSCCYFKERPHARRISKQVICSVTSHGATRACGPSVATDPHDDAALAGSEHVRNAIRACDNWVLRRAWSTTFQMFPGWAMWQ